MWKKEAFDTKRILHDHAGNNSISLSSERREGVTLDREVKKKKQLKKIKKQRGNSL